MANHRLTFYSFESKPAQFLKLVSAFVAAMMIISSFFQTNESQTLAKGARQINPNLYQVRVSTNELEAN
ncbi:MAG: hypothetical protein V4736_08945 [Bdellovibrionota bacterium]